MAKIPKPRFNLKTPKSKNETLIFLVYRYRGKKLLYSTGLTVSPTDWDFKVQRPIEKEKRLDLLDIRKQINDLESFCKSIYIKSNYGAVSVSKFKEQLDIKTNRKILKPIEEQPAFLEFLDLELKEMEAANMKHSSLKTFKRHVAILKEYAKYHGQYDYEDVDWNFRLGLIDWLASRNVQLAYGNKTLSVLRQFLEKARRRKLHSNTDYQGVGWSVTRKKAKGQRVVLNFEELDQLAKLELSGFEEKVRDLFLIGAGTGQRFSDFSRYTPENFYKTTNGIPILSIISQKTDTPAKIPLTIFSWLIPTLEKYNYQSPKIAMQNFNDVIKEICQKAGFEDKVFKS